MMVSSQVTLALSSCDGGTSGHTQRSRWSHGQGQATLKDLHMEKEAGESSGFAVWVQCPSRQGNAGPSGCAIMLDICLTKTH